LTNDNWGHNIIIPKYKIQNRWKLFIVLFTVI